MCMFPLIAAADKVGPWTAPDAVPPPLLTVRNLHSVAERDGKQTPQKPQNTASVPSSPAFTEEELKKLDDAAEMLLEEFLLNYDEQEAGECLQDLHAPRYHHKVVSKVGLQH